ncbi:four helix bundle protein [Virgibacillus flavescens]|uniref:four helix bundle protein n=1 Tax=Virgibacillus flavescens TaxID=1611422 RepID=UPI003D355ADC
MQGKRKPYPNDPRKTDVYNKALDFMNDMYDAIESFPDIEKYCMCNQIRRAVSSISANIAEGRQSFYYSKEFSHLDIAISSAGEIRAFLDMGLLRSYITYEQHQQLDKKAEEIVKMLIGLMNWVDKQIENAGKERAK